MVARKYDKRHQLSEGFKDPGHLMIFLPGERGDTVLDVPQQYQQVGIGGFNRLYYAFQAGLAPAPEMKTMDREVSLYSEMQVRDDKDTFLILNDECRSISKKF